MALAIASIPEIQRRLKRAKRELGARKTLVRKRHKIATVRQMCEGPGGMIRRGLASIS